MTRNRFTLFALLLAVTVTLSPFASADEVRGDIDQASEAWTLIEDGALIIDVRSPEEFEDGGIEGAVNVPHAQTDALAEAIGDDRERTVVLYCGSGRRAGMAIEALEAMGYENLHNGSGLEALQKTRP